MVWLVRLIDRTGDVSYLLNAKLPDSNLSYKASGQYDKRSNEMEYLAFQALT